MTDPALARKASFFTLGCKLNFAETSAIGRILKERGFSRADHDEKPDIIVVNTCSVTAMADKKGRGLIRRLSRQWPDATMVVTGCYAQLKPEEVASLPGVDIVLGSDEKLRIAEFLDSWISTREQCTAVSRVREVDTFRPSCERGDRTRYFLKVQDGCDYFCTYCTIPYARGRSRSGRIADLVAQARRVADEGGREIVITGVNIGDFGRGTDSSFFDLIRRLDEVPGILRYRISSIEPNLITPEIISWVAGESRAFMPHFHIPLQAGSDEVLRLMGRRYDTSLFADRIRMIRELIPEAFIGIDVIAGARGETPQEWERGLEFIRSLDFSKLHVFPYSERPGTAALRLAYAVEESEKHRRVAKLTALSDVRLAAFARRQEGTVRPVLWEQPHEGAPAMHGFTDNYLRVEAPFDAALINTIERVSLGAPDRNCTLPVAGRHNG